MIKRSNGKNLQIGFEQIFQTKKFMRILSSDEKFSDIGGVYSSKNNRVVRQ